MNPDVEQALSHLESAKESISKYLDGKNKRGLITNITNAAYDIKKYYAEIEEKSETLQNN